MVVSGGVMLGEVIDEADVQCIFSLVGDSVLDPVQAHVHGYGAAFFDHGVDNASTTGIVSLNGVAGAE
jgi:hypothetical protein